MGYTVELLHATTQEPVLVPYHNIGSNVLVTNATMFDASTSVSYNYRPYLIKSIGNSGIYELDGKTGKATIKTLKRAIEALGNQRNTYWEPLEGDCKVILEVLLEWAVEHKNAVWRIS